MPYRRTSSRSAAQSSLVGMWTFANSSRTFGVVGSHAPSTYLSKNSPVAYVESSNPAKRSPRSRAISIEARIAWNSTV